MMTEIKQWDEALFHFLNAQRLDWLDPVMKTLTGTYIWIPLYAFLIYLIFKSYGMTGFWYVGFIVLLILLADKFTSGFMKPFFERLRPCHDPRWEGMINTYAGCGGKFGFASSHASTTFSVATYMFLIFRGKIQAMGWLFLWAGLISYTRIYLGVHYPSDILVGALVGIASGLITFSLVEWLRMVVEKKKTTNASL
ncbi:phosphatase PAP2 family protein [Lunatibacter salilacus]|uniref:phosphatase PAP2 family protein n=1 Tax=Lunatibacter salilacus TaxID=2483804 RepID=UPI00131AB214|nr:phosphatase PAP2 family protein [Lunatibacter salilacus]